ncbi:MAG: 50S ribosomal protein L3 [Candidatus Marinimicrobia bacterium]|nr:50S ribosomal protein L3 [Candidatus Neomarinimicrobiota bacterium]
MRGLIGKKIGMTQVYNQEGTMIPVTIVEAGPCTVIQVKSINNDGYEAVQVGFGERKAKHVNKPLNGQFKKSGVQPKKILMEFNIVPGFNYKQGQEFNVSLFKEGDRVHVSGISKGAGFAGVIKRHNFHRQPETHGQTEYLRHPGSIGQASSPSRVFKGMRMAGHKGNKRVTVKNLEIVKVDIENNMLVIKGAVPGANNNIVAITK